MNSRAFHGHNEHNSENQKKYQVENYVSTIVLVYIKGQIVQDITLVI